MTIGGEGGGGQPISISSTSTSCDSAETTTQPDTITTARKQTIYRRHFGTFINYCSLLHKNMQQLILIPIPTLNSAGNFQCLLRRRSCSALRIIKAPCGRKVTYLLSPFSEVTMQKKIKDGGLCRVLRRFKLIRRLMWRMDMS